MGAGQPLGPANPVRCAFLWLPMAAPLPFAAHSRWVEIDGRATPVRCRYVAECRANDWPGPVAQSILSTVLPRRLAC